MSQTNSVYAASVNGERLRNRRPPVVDDPPLCDLCDGPVHPGTGQTTDDTCLCGRCLEVILRKGVARVDRPSIIPLSPDPPAE